MPCYSSISNVAVSLCSCTSQQDATLASTGDPSLQAPLSPTGEVSCVIPNQASFQEGNPPIPGGFSSLAQGAVILLPLQKGIAWGKAIEGHTDFVPPSLSSAITCDIQPSSVP